MLKDKNAIKHLLRPNFSVAIPPAMQPKIWPTTRILATDLKKMHIKKIIKIFLDGTLHTEPIFCAVLQIKIFLNSCHGGGGVSCGIASWQVNHICSDRCQELTFCDEVWKLFSMRYYFVLFSSFSNERKVHR